MKWIIEWYGRNTFVRHILIAIVSVAVVEYADVLTSASIKWFHTDSVQALSTGAVAFIVRWAQTNIELLVVKARTPKTLPTDIPS